MTTRIRPFEEADAGPVVALYNRHPDNPNPVEGGITAGQFLTELAARRTARFFVAVDRGADGVERPVGTFGLFRSTGRRTTGPGELIADMFFVAPAWRNGIVTGALFTEAVGWMLSAGHLVLRLTVNPANSTAFRIYRRVGCVAVGYAAPGADGNVELHNHIALVLRSVLADLREEEREALRDVASFGCLVPPREDDLASDVVLRDGRRTVEHRLTLGRHVLTAVVDVDAGAVLAADVAGPAGRRELRVVAPGHPGETPAVQAAPHELRSGDLVAAVDPRTGTLTVHHPGHLGPLLTSTWPGGDPARPAGWREHPAVPLRLTRDGDDLVVDQPPLGGVRTTVRVRLRGGVLEQRVSSCDGDGVPVAPAGRWFQTTGLRHGTVSAPGGDVPIGLGAGVRDSGEVVAAGSPLPASISWRGSGLSVTSEPGPSAVLVHSTLVELLPTAGERLLRTTFGVGGGDSAVTLDAAAGGVVAWHHAHRKVLASPYPRVRRLASNPRWSAGLWVSREPARHDAATGLGWGVGATGGWLPDGPHGLRSVDGDVSWSVTPTRDGISVGLKAAASAAEGPATEELVAWVTPNCRPGATVRFPGQPDSGTTTRTTWERWGTAVEVTLADGRRLSVRPGPDAPPSCEVVVRSTPGGLLIGCVTHVPHLSGSAHWLLEPTA